MLSGALSLKKMDPTSMRPLIIIAGGVEKKLRVAKKAWKRFTNTLQSKFHKLNISRTVKTATRHLSSTFQRSLRLLIPWKLRPRLRRSKSSFSSYYHHEKYNFQQYNHLHYQNNFAAIHIDELFDDQPASTSAEGFNVGTTETSKGKDVVVEEKSSPEKDKSIYSIEDAWNAVVASSPHLRPVDERAEEFIRKFRQDIILQKEKSLLEFREMLARSA